MMKKLLVLGIILCVSISLVFARNTKKTGVIQIVFSELYPAQTASRVEWFDSSKIYNEYLWTHDTGRKAYTGYTTNTGDAIIRDDTTTTDTTISGTDIWVANLYEYKDARFLGAGALVKSGIGYNDVYTLSNYDGVKKYYKVVWYLNPKLGRANTSIYEKNLVLEFKAYRWEQKGMYSTYYDYEFDSTGTPTNCVITTTYPTYLSTELN